MKDKAQGEYVTAVLELRALGFRQDLRRGVQVVFYIIERASLPGSKIFCVEGDLQQKKFLIFRTPSLKKRLLGLMLR